MDSRLLCWVALCLLRAGPVDPEVTQIPKYLIKARSQTVNLKCSYKSTHDYVYWYKQSLGKSPDFLACYYGGEEREKGNIPDRFSVQQFSLDHRSELNMSSTEVNDSAVYLCASSLTALPSQQSPAQKLSFSGQETEDPSPHCRYHEHLLPGLCDLLDSAGLGQVNITQTPTFKILKVGQSMTMLCAQRMGHTYMYWYRQDMGQGLKLIYYSVGANSKEKGDVPDGYEVSRENTENFHLILKSAVPAQTSVYLCASSVDPGDYDYTFGSGTKLTVLDDLSQVKPPKVAVFEPSEAEITQTQKATLVCLATGFFPDHVELSWWVNGKEVKSGVSTDPQAFKENDTSYCLSSRLRVSAAFWHDPRNHFRCQVHFYGLSQDDKPIPVSAEAWGRADCGITAMSYKQGVLSATILYEILLGKAALYAALVSALVLMAMVKKKHS